MLEVVGIDSGHPWPRPAGALRASALAFLPKREPTTWLLFPALPTNKNAAQMGGIVVWWRWWEPNSRNNQLNLREFSNHLYSVTPMFYPQRLVGFVIHCLE